MKKLHTIKKEIINAFNKGIFSYTDGFHEKKEEDTDEEMDTTIMPELESEESAAERNQQRGGVKILSSNTKNTKPNAK